METKKFSKTWWKRHVVRTELFIFLAIVILGIIIQYRSGQFFTSYNFINIARALVVPGMFTLLTHMALISGGTDVSYPSIATLSMFIVSTRMLHFEGNIIFFFLVAAALGAIMGALNGFLIAKYKFPTLIVTLGTSSIFTGILQGVLGAHESPIPQAMDKLGKAKIFEVVSGQGRTYAMPITFIFFIVLIFVVWFIMNRTMLGRGIYAIGGDLTSAERAGFNVFGIQMFVYIFIGAMAGFIGVTQAVMMRNCHPTNLNGMEMTTIAAAVLGGTNMTGGKGTIWGALLGIMLMVIMSNSMILLGISTNWQRVFTGLIILIGTGVTAIQSRSAEKKTGALEAEKDEAHA